MKKHIVGIDLGTTNSVCCTIKNGKFEYIKFRGRDILPSAILWKDQKMIVGDNARKKSAIYAENFIKSSKTYIGSHDKKWIIEGREFVPTDIAAEILNTIRLETEKYFGTKDEITAVISVPAYFTSNQISETIKAGEKAGLKVKQIITEPVAAAIAYGFDEEVDNTIFVVDIGGGTFDVSILKIDGNEYKTLAVEGDSMLGGDDFDNIILDMCLAKIRQTMGMDLSSFEKSGLNSPEQYSQARQRLIIEVENKKIELSDADFVDIDIPNLITYKDTTYNFSLSITREEFIEESKTLLNKIKRKITKCLEDAKIVNDEIDKVILVGGTANMPIIQEYVKGLFGKDPFADKDLSKLVAMGAALVADCDEDTIILRDIISHSLGIRIVNNRFHKILIKCDQYPISKSSIFTTVVDGQESIQISVYEGECEEDNSKNYYYGQFLLKNIEKAKIGIPKIEVTFSFDKSRNLEVTAKDLKTGSVKAAILKINRD